MTNIKTCLQTQSGPWLYLLCALLSIFLFSYTLYLDDILNDDGMDYVFAAHDYMNGQFESARLFRPEQAFYAQIAFVAQYSGLSLVQSAYSLSLIAQIALMCGFLALIRVLDGNTVTQLLGILVFVSLYHLNEFRPHILKGFMFWACQLWALWALIRYVQSARWVFLFTWVALGLISLVYRIEGIVYLAGTLVVLPLVARGQARKRFLLLASSGLIAIVIIVASQLHDGNNPGAATPSVSENHFTTARLKAELKRGETIFSGLERQKELFRETLPNKWAKDSASHFLIGGLLFQVVKVILFSSNLLLLLLALSIGKPSLIPRTNSHKLIAAYFLIGVAVCLYSVTSRFFVTDRYAFFPALLLCLPIPFLLAPLFINRISIEYQRHQVFRLLVFVIAAQAILATALRDNNDKMYIPEAGDWINENLPNPEKVYYNDRKIAFYAEAYANRSFRMNTTSLDSLRDQGYVYAVVHSEARLRKQQQILLNTIRTEGNNIHSVHGPKHKRVDIYDISTQR
ncbi:MAG TPA: hypothetical protein DCF62_09705 [Porticoccaceae bacterium]|nr:hypothetical protein [Porticoccaceae bacterium]